MTKINLEKNIQLCFNNGFDSLKTAKSDEEYRIAIISIHNGLELLMKWYLMKKDELLIYKKINYRTIIKDRTDLRKKVNFNRLTIPYSECIIILDYFSELPEKFKTYLEKLNKKRNACIHFEYYYEEKELRKLLISHIYQFICELILEMSLEPKDFISEKNIIALDNFKNTIDDEIKQDYLTKIEIAKKHYSILTDMERTEKDKTIKYTKGIYDVIVQCPACKKNALLTKIIQKRTLSRYNPIVIKRDLILKDLSCHYCALNITDYDQLEIEFKDEEKSLRSRKIYNPFPDDCPDDCPGDCPYYDDCPGDCPDDCPYYDDCPDDCPPDCPDDC